MPNDPPLLSLESIRLGYGDIVAVWDVSFMVRRGSICALVGPNGAGKTTICKGIAGTLRPKQGKILLDSQNISSLRPWQRAELGVGVVQEGKRVFRGLSVIENLKVGLSKRHVPRKEASHRIDEVFTIFPVLADRRRAAANALSGGQQQMLAIGQAILGHPRLLVIDEPSSGLAPVVVDDILRTISYLRSRSMAIVLVDQLDLLAEIADAVIALDRGRISLDAEISDLEVPKVIDRIYFGQE